MKNIKFFILVCLSTLSVITFAQSTDYPFEVTVTGQGKPDLVLIPGFGCSGDVWEETVLQYKKQFTCHVLTMPGFAGVKPQENPSFQGWSDEIADYIKTEKLEQPLLIGHSMGGGLAMNIAADHPKLISKIIVVDALPCMSALMNPAFKSKENPDCSASANQLLALTDEQFQGMQQMTIGGMLADETKRETVLEWTLTSDRKTMGMMFCSFTNTDLREKIKNIECPALILLEAPFIHNRDAMEGQYSALKTADIRFAEQGLHFIMYDDQDWYFEQLNNFIFIK